MKRLKCIGIKRGQMNPICLSCKKDCWNGQEPCTVLKAEMRREHIKDSVLPEVETIENEEE